MKTEREAVKELSETGHSVREIADIIGVSKSVVSETGQNLKPEPPDELEQSKKREAEVVRDLRPLSCLIFSLKRSAPINAFGFPSAAGSRQRGSSTFFQIRVYYQQNRPEQDFGRLLIGNN
jgi:hypothetical protein